MKFSCEKVLLQEAILTCGYCVAPKSPMPVLEGLLFQADRDVHITSYDLKKGIVAAMPATVEEPGSLVLEYKFMNALIRSLSDGIVTIASTEDGLDTLITNGDASFHTVGTKSGDFPEMPAVDQKKAIRLPQSLLGKMIRQTVFAVSDNETRPVYTGELFDVKGDWLTMVAVDGFRLAMRREKVNAEDVEDCSFIVPGNALNNLEKLCGDTEEKVNILVGENHISFQVGSKTLITRRLEGDFLDYEKTIPTNFSMVFQVDRKMLDEAVSRISIVLENDNKTPLRFAFRENLITISCSSGIRRGKEVIPYKGNADWSLDIGFNSSYVLNALRAIPQDEVKLNMISSSSPCVITPKEDENNSYKYMILPVRLKSGS